jgi:hypothetical protein
MEVSKLFSPEDFNSLTKEEPCTTPSPEASNLNTAVLKQFADLEEKKSELETALTIIKAEIAKLDQIVQDQLISSGIKKISISGRTIFVKERIVAKYESRPKAIEALKRAGLFEFVVENFNTTSLNAYISGLVRDGYELPSEFEGDITHDSIYRASSVKA